MRESIELPDGRKGNIWGDGKFCYANWKPKDEQEIELFMEKIKEIIKSYVNP